ncbi:cytochrome d ubiquinol oxidase subunit II [Tumebacillus sp. DT12]|uniref:Cytochrome d ubiquinol oxidase subunit II n=1 Tax=Tumebacillus lacus TaxID=2995335 RepID=A0ABT3X1S9_9BACL|nr:cytochrome d ubiquinol oxidase subunit II [Tumebacillus lacus]MCX7569737.1 cytochrome d ubiquinol oxidase subunit II [Tumebacillus lacus]
MNMTVTDEIIAVTLIWLFVFVYAIAAAIDFGAGFWSFFYRNRKKNNMSRIANRYLSPSWELTNTFIVLVVVGLVSFFPGVTRVLGAVLLVPFSIGVLLLAVRSAFLVYSHSVDRYKKTLILISGLTGIFIPALLILVLPITYGDMIDTSGGVERLLWGELLASSSTYAYIAFAVTSTLFLSSLLLSDYAHVSEDHEAYRVYRRDALILGPITLLSSVAVVVTMQFDAPWMYENLFANQSWILASVVAFALGYWAVYVKKPRLATLAVVTQYLLAATGYGRAHLPYLVYPGVTIESGFTAESTFHALFISYLVGFAILTPGFLYFWKLFMTDRQYLKKR